MWRLLVAMALLTNAVTATAGETITLEQYLQNALSLDAELQGARADLQIAQAKEAAAANLAQTSLEVSPYSQTYRLLEPPSSSNYSYDERGTLVQLSQTLPFGTQVSLSTSQLTENTRTSTFAPKTSYGVSLVQPLFKNSFGKADRLAAKAAQQKSQASQTQVQLQQNSSCYEATSAYIDTWIQAEHLKFVAEVVGIAEELYKKATASQRRGQLGRLDWLGVQSDYYDVQNLRLRHQQQLNLRQAKLEQFGPEAKGKALTSPEAALKPLGEQLRESAAPTTAELAYLEALSQALQSTSVAEESNSLPQLDLKVSKKTAEGVIAGTDYKDEDLAVSLNLIWYLNNENAQLASRVARLEGQKVQLQLDEAKRSRSLQFTEALSSIRTQMEQIEIERQRVAVLDQITSETKNRFLQGRIEFQDFLRIKEQWLDSHRRLLESQATLWKDLTRFSLDEALPVRFCRSST